MKELIIELMKEKKRLKIENMELRNMQTAGAILDELNALKQELNNLKMVKEEESEIQSRVKSHC